MPSQKHVLRVFLALAATLLPVVLAVSLGGISPALQTVTLTVNADQPGAKIDPIFYGLMTEEINFSYDGGLYAELIRNRTFRDRGKIPPSWFLYEWGNAEASMA